MHNVATPPIKLEKINVPTPQTIFLPWAVDLSRHNKTSSSKAKYIAQRSQMPK